MPTTPTKPILGAIHIAGVKPNPDINGNPVPCTVVVDDAYDPPRLVFELPDRALRDLGTVSIDGSVFVESEYIYVNGVATQVKRATANIAQSQTDSAIVAAVASKKIRVIAGVFLAGSTATNITFNTKPGGAGSAISPTFQSAANGGAMLAPNIYGWFETASGEGLSATTGAGATTGVLVNYIEV